MAGRAARVGPSLAIIRRHRPACPASTSRGTATRTPTRSRRRSATPSSSGGSTRATTTCRCASGDVNAQTAWVLERAGAPEPEFLRPHHAARARRDARRASRSASHREPIRRVGQAMAREDLDLVPIVDDDGALAGVMTERALARRYIRESREASSLRRADAGRARSSRSLEGRLVAGEDREIAGRVWVLAMDVDSLPSEIREGDVVVVGDRPDAQRAAIELGVGAARHEQRHRARRRGAGARARAGHGRRLLAAGQLRDQPAWSRSRRPCRALMDAEPLTVRPDDLLSDVAEEVKEVHYRAASRSTARAGRSASSPARDLVDPAAAARAARRPRRAGAERARRRAGRDRRDPRPPPHRLDRDQGPGRARRSTRSARPRRSSSSASARTGWSPAAPTATMLLGAVLSDTVILNSPTTTERDRAVVEYLERVLRARRHRVRARDVREHLRRLERRRRGDRLAATPRSTRSAAGQHDLHRPGRDGRAGLLERRDELLEALERRARAAATTRSTR